MKIKDLILHNNYILYMVLCSFLFISQGCSDDDEQQKVREGWLRILPLELDFPANGGTKEVYLVTTADMDLEKITFEVASNGQDWCELARTENNLFVTVEPTYYEQPRATIIKITYEDVVRELPINQEASKGSDDILIEVMSATATSEETEQEPRGIAMSHDGKYDTYFNSKFGAISEWPFNIEYTLKTPNTLNKIIYHPRSDSGNKWGSFNEYEVWVATEENPSYVKVGTYKRGDANHSVTMMTLDSPVQNAKKVRFDIYSAYQNRISCAEMEFVQSSTNKYDYSKIFANRTYSQLNPGITADDIKKIPEDVYKQLATSLLNNTYNTEFRVGEYRPYQNPSVQAKTHKTNPYSLRDNPTGIYADNGDELLVIVDNPDNQSLSMVVQDLSIGYGSSRSYPLLDGENKIKVSAGGLIYIQNLTEDAIPLILETESDKASAATKTVRVHFVNGKVNGYFNSQIHTADDWTRILRSAKYEDIDVFGKYAHITWNTQNFRDFDTNIASVVDKYDRLVYLQQDFMGLVKYNKMFNNRMYFHIDYNGASPYASNNRTAYTPRYTEIFCNASRFEARLWGPAHEVGHCNQTRPGLKWAGTTEVTNNIHSMYIQQQFGEKSKLLVDGTYAEAKAAIIDAGQPHCLDNASNEFMLKLVPFWQLKLYMVEALGKEDFYRDLYEHYRTTADLNTDGVTQGILQLDFVRQVCRISGLNMLDFFDKWGFLKPVDKVLNDYGNKQFTITQAQINALIKEIQEAGYDTPHPNVYDITEENIDQFRN